VLFYFSVLSIINKSQVSTVGIATDSLLVLLGLFPISERCLHMIDTESWAHPASYLMGTGWVKGQERDTDLYPISINRP
jgi:hypothetical protein